MKLFLILVLASLLGPIAFGAELRMSTYNIKNYNYDRRTGLFTDDQKLIEIFNEISPQILALQEVVNEDALKSVISKFNQNFSVVITKCGGYAKQKIAVAFNKKRFQLLETKELKDLSLSSACNSGVRPALLVKLRDKKEDIELDIIAVHLKAGAADSSANKRIEQLGLLKKHIEELKRSGEKNIVLLGDFNTTNFVLGNEYHDAFVDFADTEKLTNFAQEVQCSSYWWGGISDGLQHPGLLDHILISNSLEGKYQEVTASSGAHCKKNNCLAASEDELGMTYKRVSDHCPVTLTLKTEGQL